MKKTFLTMATLTAAAAAVFYLAPPSFGQDGPPAGGPPGGARGGRGGGRGGARGPAEPAGPMPKGPDGHPDFSGFWNLPDPPAAGVERIEPPAGEAGGAEARGGGARGGGGGGVARGGGEARGGGGEARGGGGGARGAGGGGGGFGRGGRGNPGWVIDPPDGKIPYTPEARAHQEDLLKNHLAEEPELNCYESGVPHSEANRFGAQILMTPGYLVQLTEFLHAVRVIPIDPKRPHIDAKYHLFQGDPIAHWEGDTLVVDTTNQNDKTWFDLSGNFKTTNLHVTEKFIPVDANTITYEATMHDPTIYTRDWTMRWNLTRMNTRPNSDGHPYELMEFACIEGNRDPGHYTQDEGGKASQVLGKKE